MKWRLRGFLIGASLPFSISISVVAKGAEQRERDLQTLSYTYSTVFAFDGLLSIDGEKPNTVNNGTDQRA
ncbi:hypothetical protein MPTK2_1g12800 [Marchantia polymorpha subsp. ruderalis]